MTVDYVELTKSFEVCDIDAGTFTHCDHVGVAYEMLCTYSFLDAVTKYANCINVIATRAGAAQKFNVTITIAFLSLIAERIKLTEHDTYQDFIAKNPDLLSADVLQRWYSADRLQSDLARKVFLMPDTRAA